MTLATPDDRHAIQLNEPRVARERRGCFRRDGEPHRGNLLWLLALVSLGCSLMSSGVCGMMLVEKSSPWKVLLLLPPLVVGFPLGLGAWYLARRDLARMRVGLVDPDGDSPTRRARDWSIVAFLASWVIEGVLLYLVCFGPL